jgi:hypothetical protein
VVCREAPVYFAGVGGSVTRSDDVYQSHEFVFFYHLMCHPYTYVIYISYGERELMLYVNEGRVEAHKDSAVVAVGL